MSDLNRDPYLVLQNRKVYVGNKYMMKSTLCFHLICLNRFNLCVKKHGIPLMLNLMLR